MSNKISLDMIPTNNKYEGYLWWSNEDRPEVFQNEILSSKVHELWPTKSNNPFIIEGNLWDSISEISYLIRFIDGEYLVFRYEMNGIHKDNITKISYLPHRMPEVEKLIFNEVWLEQPDINCLNFKVLKPAFTAFVGFLTNKEDIK